MDWDALAERYDAQLWLEHRAVRTAVRLAAVRREDRLLDVGTGTGAVLAALARRGDRPCHATGVDASEAMLARVGPLPRGWALVRADIKALPFASGSFDVAIVSYLLHVLDAPARIPALREIARVLRPGGLVVTVTPALPLRGDSALQRRIVRRFERETGPLRGLLPLDPRLLLTSAGFDVERSRRVWLGYPSLCVRARRI